jgi:hypothetical protein
MSKAIKRDLALNGSNKLLVHAPHVSWLDFSKVVGLEVDSEKTQPECGTKY